MANKKALKALEAWTGGTMKSSSGESSEATGQNNAVQTVGVVEETPTKPQTPVANQQQTMTEQPVRVGESDADVTDGKKTALQKKRSENAGRPTKDTRPSMEQGTKAGETRATFIIQKQLLRKLKFISLMDTRLLKDIISESLTATVEEWEKENGKIKLK